VGSSRFNALQLRALHREANEVTPILTQEQLAAIHGFAKSPTKSEGLAMCHNCFLSELPGVIFGIVTVIWIVGAIGLLNR
jgi:hypothetical protein